MRTPASVREKENRKFKKVMLRRKKLFLLKQLGKEIWKEWGISKKELGMLLAAAGMIVVIPILLMILGSLI